jgi:uncharacterized LabA/DUF88 family protein
MKRICIFVDGENFRFSIVDLFPGFNKEDYLPREARWQAFFDWLSYEGIKEVSKGESNFERVRTYWYVINEVYSIPYLPNPEEDMEGFLRVMRKHKDVSGELRGKSGEERLEACQKHFKWAMQNKENLSWRSRAWKRVQNEIARLNRSVEFRRAGVLKHNMITNQLLGEKGVDVKLAIDLIELKDIYDVAVILSGDQDYIPAVNEIKDYGKWVVNIAFEKPDGGLLPGGAKRLNQVTDWSFAVPYSSLRGYVFGGSTELGGFEPLD